ncbi:MAG TPA: hypothetical protein EYQ60_12255 [Myxococcales bacterium]|nr:hypothetical protein [Myxococcales bacterium]HIK86104.1 hypothetical protein [Myxococcales bacterium]
MMKRFSRRHRGGSDKPKSSIEVTEWLPKLLEQGIVEAKSLDSWSDPGIPSSVAAIGRGEKADGTALIVSFSPKSATEALLAGLSAAAYAVEKDQFAGQVIVVSPNWDSAARRLLSLLGRTAYALECIASPTLGAGRSVVQSEPPLRVLAASAGQLASRLSAAAARADFRRAALALEGLAAKHGGSVRVGLERIELVVLARRVAELRVKDGAAVLETQIGGRSTTSLAGTELAGAFDGLEGQIRRRLNDRKVRDGEEGLRGRVIAELSRGAELRALCPWPSPGTDLDVIDGVGLNAEGDAVVVAIREEVEWTSLAAIIAEMGPLATLLPTLFAENAPPIRLAEPRLLLVAERFGDGIERALAAFTLPYELRKVSDGVGAGLDVVSSGDGAQARPSARRGRRRGGRGRTGGSEEAKAEGSPRGPAAEVSEGSGESRTSRSSKLDGQSTGEGSTDAEESGRGRSRRRRRPRGERSDASEEAVAETSSGRDRDSGSGRARAERGPRKGATGAPRFEEVSLMDLEDGSGRSERSSRLDRPGDDDPDEPRPDGSGGRDRSRRGGRRGRRGGRGDASRGGNGNGGDGEGRSGSDGPTAQEVSAPEEADPDAVAEEDLVDADDLSEILARLADETSTFDGSDSSDESYEDAEEIDEDDVQSARRRDRDSRRRSQGEDSGDSDRVGRGRAAILVHGDRDSLLSAVLLARDIRQLEGLWIYPQAELMTFFRSIATDLRDDTPIFVIGFAPSPARDVIQASALYRGRLQWFGRQAWPPEDLVALREALGSKSVHGGEGIDSLLPLVLETCTRRSRFSDKLVDLATGRFTQHDFERWGRLWRWRAEEIANKSGDIRGDIADLLAGRPSDLAKEAALVEIPPVPPEVTWVAGRDFPLVHFGGHVMVVVDVDEDLDIQLCARIARERYSATLSLAHQTEEATFVFAGDEIGGKRALDYLAVADHLANKLEWVESRSDGDHVSRFHVRELERYPERQEEIIGEIAMGRSLLER